MYLFYRKSLAVAGLAAAVVGSAGAALATSGGDTVHGAALAAASVRDAAPSAAPSAAGKDKDAKAKHKGALLRRLEHGQFVTRTKKGTVTHTIWRGTLTAVSPTSVTVKAKDAKSQTYAITKDTKIVERAKKAKPAPSSVAKLAKGDTVFVMGTGTPTVTAKRIVEIVR